MKRVRYSKDGLSGALVTKKDHDIILQGPEFLAERNDPGYMGSDHINLLQGVGAYVNFLYTIQMIESQAVTKEEVGIGRLVETEDHNFKLIRIETLDGRPKKCFYSAQDAQSYTRVSSGIPQKFYDFAVRDNTVISFNKNTIDIIELEQGSVLGNVYGRIEPVTLEELALRIDKVPALVSTHLPIDLETQELSISSGPQSTVKTSILRVVPDMHSDKTKPIAQQGMVIYNSESRNLQFYDGEEWRTLVWQ